MPRKLLILDDAPITGGAELFALRLAHWVDGDPGWTVTIACPGDSDFARVCTEAGIVVRPTRYPDLVPSAAPQMIPALRDLAGLLRRAGSENALVVANTARAQAYAAMARLILRRRPPIVNLVHEQDTAARRSARTVFRRTGRVVAVGANNAATYRAALPGLDVMQLNNFLDPEQFEVTPAPAPAHGLPAVGVLARLIPEKGIAELITELATADSSWSTLRLAGGAQDPGYAADLARKVEMLGLSDRIVFGGHIADLDPFFAAIDVLVVPSTGSEGQPTVILEALAHGRPVIVRRPIWSTDFTGLPVTPYTTAAELAAALSAPASPPSATALEQRFGPQQALDVLVAAAA